MLTIIVCFVPTNILVGTDGSRTASKAVDRAVELAKGDGASLTILCVGPRSVAEEAVKREASRLAEAGIPIRTVVASGEPAKALVEAASAGSYDLLVIGNRGMTGISRFLRLGSVPSRVMHRIPCNLLIVKTS